MTCWATPFNGLWIVGTPITAALRLTALHARTATAPSANFAGARGSPLRRTFGRTTEITSLRITVPAASEFAWSGRLGHDAAYSRQRDGNAGARSHGSGLRNLARIH